MKSLLSRISPSPILRESPPRAANAEIPVAGRASAEGSSADAQWVKVALDIEAEHVKVRFKLKAEVASGRTPGALSSPSRAPKPPVSGRVASHPLGRGAGVSAGPSGGHLPGAEPPHLRLHRAVLQNNPRVVAECVWRAPFRVDDADEYGRTAAHLAAASSRSGMLLGLLRGIEGVGADVNACTRFGLTPLHYAAARGHFQIACILLGHGADPDARTAFGATALELANLHRREPIMRLLWQHTSALPLDQWTLSPNLREEYRRLCSSRGEMFAVWITALSPDRANEILNAS